MTFPSTDQMFRDTTQSKHPPRNEGRSQRNDRPPRFQKDGDFPKPSAASSSISQPQKWRDGERMGRGGSERWKNDTQDARNMYTSMGKSREQQGPTGKEHNGSKTFPQEPHSGGLKEQDGTGPALFRKNQSNGPAAPKSSNPSASGSDPKSRNDPNNRRKGKPERPNSGYFERSQDATKKDFSQDAGSGQVIKVGGVSNAQFPNGDLEHRRTGAVKMHSSAPPQKQTNMHNSAPKKRSGPIKGLREQTDTNNHINWRAGDQCLALYWEDNKVSHLHYF